MRQLILLCVILCCGVAAAVENYPHRSDYLWLTVPDHADWLYRVGEKAKVEVSFYRYGMPQDVEVTYGIGQDMLPDSSTGKVMLKNGRATIDMGTMRKPGCHFICEMIPCVILHDGEKAFRRTISQCIHRCSSRTVCP